MKKSILQNIKSAFNLSYLALIVLFCFAISTSFMSINYVAKYLSTDGGFDGARVAKFEVSSLVAVEQSSELILWENEKTTTYQFTVDNKSDVSVDYDIVLEFPSNLPNGSEITVDNESPDNVEGCVYTFSVGTFAVGEATKTHTLQITVSNYDVDVFLQDISVKVIAEQID